jgi:hypothetical protein
MFVSQIIDEASEILATTDREKVFRKLTQAVQILMESGHYLHTNAEVDVCTGWDGQTITLPRGVEVPLGVNVDGSPTYFRGRLFQYHVNKGGMYNPVDWAWDDRGFVSTIMDIRQPSQILAIAEHNSDAGKQIRVLGTDSNNRELRSQLPDGQTIDGVLVDVHSQGDFPYGTIVPDGVQIDTRKVSVSPISQFISASAHQLSSGQSAVYSVVSGDAPKVLVAGKTYYIGVNDDNEISLYNSSLDAQYKNNKINLQSIVNSGTIRLTDSRKSSLLTSVNFVTSPSVAIDTPNSVSFSTGTGSGFSTGLPTPLIAGATYYANPQDTDNLLIYSSFADAQNKANPVLMSGSSGKFNIDIRKQISPQTTLKFNVKHYYSNGDEVQAFTSGGTLPAPLIPGQKYFVNVIDAFTVSLHTNLADANSSTANSLSNPVVLTDAGTGVNALVKLINATSTIGTQSQITAPGFPVAAPLGSGATASAVVVGSVVQVNLTNAGSGYGSTVPTVTFSPPPSPPEGSGQIASTATGYAVMVPESPGSPTNKVGSIVLTNAGSGYSSAPTITFSTGNASASSTIQTSLVSRFTITNGGSGYTDTPIVKIAGGGGTGATAVAVVDPNSNTVTGVNIITEGTGYTSTPTVTITASSGVFVEFVSTGTLPAPLESGVAYTAEPPLNTTTGNFTVKTTQGNTINITSAPTGNFYLALSRSFTVGFNYIWNADFSGMSTGQGVYLDSDYLLPSGVSNNVLYYIRKLNNTSAQLYNTAENANAITSTQGLVAISQLGTGQTYYAVRTPAYAKAYNNLLFVEYNQYIIENTRVRFSTTGTLPFPLTSNTDYLVSPQGEYLSIKNTNNTQVVFANNGVPSLQIGELNLLIQRDFTISPSTKIQAENSLFNTGDQLTVRPNQNDSLPYGLQQSTLQTPQYYYARSISNELIEIYDTASNALNVSSTTGRITFYDIGDSVSSTFFTDVILPPVLIKSIYHIEKPETLGYVSLYAFDNGRSNDMALIGQYHPKETNPKYRRIRIGKHCSWARVIYRVKAPQISSEYDYIPVENQRAILAALHAVDLEDKDFFDQSQKYWAVAYGYLRNQNDSMEGHAMQPPQINGICYAEGTDPVMF